MATSIERKKTRHEYLDDNQHWLVFKAALRKRDIQIYTLWQAKSSSSLKHPDIHCITFIGANVRQEGLIAIVRDYCVGKKIDEDLGYAFYTESGQRWEDDIAAICKPAAALEVAA